MAGVGLGGEGWGWDYYWAGGHDGVRGGRAGRAEVN